MKTVLVAAVSTEVFNGLTQNWWALSHRGYQFSAVIRPADIPQRVNRDVERLLYVTTLWRE